MADLNRRVVRIFLASPSDVRPEREAARLVINEINRGIARHLGYTLHLYGWEDQSPGSGRPQSLINPRVDECDIFVGVLWKLWGQPSGVYESGFSEEFHHARDRQRETKSPEIWLAFKRVDEAVQADAGPQLTQVLNFKREQISAREFLFREFKDVVGFERDLRSWLSEYILKFYFAQPSGETGPPTQSAVDLQPPSRDVSASNVRQRPVPPDLTDSAERIVSVLHQPELDGYTDGGYA
ncbi:MAG TPA: DUF4062 domain-containing protein, partial [Candidatus Acidoferrales bacterium]|nr:DUF4062 domain-containing protein [Candidatus Acidoferrales bacterium]